MILGSTLPAWDPPLSRTGCPYCYQSGLGDRWRICGEWRKCILDMLGHMTRQFHDHSFHFHYVRGHVQWHPRTSCHAERRGQTIPSVPWLHRWKFLCISVGRVIVALADTAYHPKVLRVPDHLKHQQFWNPCLRRQDANERLDDQQKQVLTVRGTNASIHAARVRLDISSNVYRTSICPPKTSHARARNRNIVTDHHPRPHLRLRSWIF